jgi:hypothetical protein
MPTYGNTDNLSEQEKHDIAAAEQGYQAFLSTCRPEDIAEMKRRDAVGLLADAGSETPNSAKLAKLLRDFITISGGGSPQGEPYDVESTKESREQLDRAGGAHKVGYSDSAVATSQARHTDQGDRKE